MTQKQWIVFLLLSLPVIYGTAQAGGAPPQEPKLSKAALSTLKSQDWDKYVGNKTGIWVNATNQMVYLISDHQVIKTYRCSTGKAGMGNLYDSGKTPLGWHCVEAKIGSKLPVGAILRSRQWTGKIWQLGQKSEEDLVLTRILWLQGLEPGKNRGGNVDSKRRYIYIHGTNDPNSLGRPTSHGCIRLDPKEVIDLYDRVEKNVPVLITGTPPQLEK